MKLDLKPTGLNFTGTSDTKKTTYHLELEFFGEIDVNESKVNHTARDIEIVLRKKELKEEYWPRLLKETAKVHFLKTDFDKVCKSGSHRKLCLTRLTMYQWVDEDEQNEAPEDDYMNNFGGGMGEDGGFGGIDFSKLGGGAGGADMPGMDGLGAEGGDDADDDDSDTEMPELEDEDKTEGKGKAKVEEVA